MILRQVIAIVIIVFFAACAATIHAPAMASLKPLANPAGDAGLDGRFNDVGRSSPRLARKLHRLHRYRNRAGRRTFRYWGCIHLF